MPRTASRACSNPCSTSIAPGWKRRSRKVEASFKAARVASYGANGGTGSILVQRMISAEFAGVLFTRDPSAGGLAMIEMVKGTAENLVSGTVRPWTFRFGRVSGRQFGEGAPPIDVAPLLALGREVETLFGRPQDIEWTWSDGRFHLVQSRDVTRVMAGEADRALAQDDLARALDVARGAAPDEVVFAKNEMSEMLPRPTPLSLSLMRTLWASGGSVDRAARKLGFSYAVAEDSTPLVTILGRLYVDKREEQARGFSIGPIAARSLLRRADRIEREFRDGFLPRFLAEVRLVEAADFDRLAIPELVEEIGRLHERFVGDTHVEVDAINIAANFYLDRARRALDRSRARAVERPRPHPRDGRRPCDRRSGGRRPPRAATGSWSAASDIAPPSTTSWPSRAMARTSRR